MTPPPVPPEGIERAGIAVRDAGPRGRGVFATRDFEEGETIEDCPVIEVPEAELPALASTVLSSYFFQWGGTGDEGAVALGYGSLYNHTNDPNAMYVRKRAHKLLSFVALRPIAAGEEITVSYHGGFGQRTKVWFEIE